MLIRVGSAAQEEDVKQEADCQLHPREDVWGEQEENSQSGKQELKRLRKARIESVDNVRDNTVSWEIAVVGTKDENGDKGKNALDASSGEG